MTRLPNAPPSTPPRNPAGPLPAGGPALLRIVAELQARVAELERVRGVGDADRPIGLREVAGRINRSPETLRGWLKRPAARRKWMLEALLLRDLAGRYYSTPRRIDIWRQTLVSAYLNSRRLRLADGASSQHASRRSGIAELRKRAHEGTGFDQDRAPGAAGAVPREER